MNLSLEEYSDVFKYSAHVQFLSFDKCSHTFTGLKLHQDIDYKITKIQYNDNDLRSEFWEPLPKYNDLNHLLKAINNSPLRDTLKKFIIKDMRLGYDHAMGKFEESGLKDVKVESLYDTCCIESDMESDYQFSFKV
mmetsp:Transcript_14052/g.15702  ORF Transcript_14052/g.15702 Transcript_14052/m.15702 type:complete len:136 (-) Transcript_14052:31-438(-)